MTAAALAAFNIRKAALQSDLWRTLVRLGGSTEVYIVFSARATREEIERFGARLVYNGVGSVPDALGLDLAPGTTFVEVATGHTWKVQEIVTHPHEAARKIYCLRLDA